MTGAGREERTGALDDGESVELPGGCLRPAGQSGPPALAGSGCAAGVTAMAFLFHALRPRQWTLGLSAAPQVPTGLTVGIQSRVTTFTSRVEVLGFCLFVCFPRGACVPGLYVGDARLGRVHRAFCSLWSSAVLGREHRASAYEASSASERQPKPTATFYLKETKQNPQMLTPDVTVWNTMCCPPTSVQRACEDR